MASRYNINAAVYKHTLLDLDVPYGSYKWFFWTVMPGEPLLVLHKTNQIGSLD